MSNKVIQSRYGCTKCEKSSSFFKEKILLNVKKYCKIVDLSYFWSLDPMQKKTKRELKSRGNSIIAHVVKF